MVKFSVKNFLFIFFIVIFSLLIIIGMALLNENVTQIGLIELNKVINDINREESDIDYMGMISKFQLHMDYYRDNIDQNQFDSGELRVSMVISSYSNSVKLYNQKNFNGFSKILLIFINFLRGLLNKRPLSFDSIDETDINLMLAYYYERNNYYYKALDKFNEILQNSHIDYNKISIITLHRAFCFAMSNNMEQAKDLLTDVIKEYNNESVAFTATTLLQYIVFFEQEIQKTKESSENSIVKSEKLYKLIAYDDAIEILDTIPLDNEEQAVKIQYIKARCYEESGEKDTAIDIYQDIIDDNADTEFARQSNSRLLIIGTMDKDLDKAKEIAKENNNDINDPQFDDIYQMTTQFEEASMDTAENKFIQKELENLQLEEPLISSESSDLTMLPELILNPSVLPEAPLIPVTTISAGLTPEMSLTPEPSTEAQDEPVIAVDAPTGLPEATNPPPEATEEMPNISLELEFIETPIPVQTHPPDMDEHKKEMEDGTYQIVHSKDNIPFKIEYFNKDGILEYLIEYLYDYDGNIIGIVKRNEQGQIIK